MIHDKIMVDGFGLLHWRVVQRGGEEEGDITHPSRSGFVTCESESGKFYWKAFHLSLPVPMPWLLVK